MESTYDKCAAKREWRKKWRSQQSQHIDWLKKSLGCSRCGFKGNPESLHFHHLDPSQRSFTISNGRKKSWGILLAEIQKCELLCKWCHTKRHRESHYECPHCQKRIEKSQLVEKWDGTDSSKSSNSPS